MLDDLNAERAEKTQRAQRKIIFWLSVFLEIIMGATLDEVNAISSTVIGCAIEVHKEVGPVVLESAFRQCLCHELHLRQIPFEIELSLPVEYKGLKIETGYRMDILVCGLVVL